MELGARTGCVFADTLRGKMLVLKDLGYDFLELPLKQDEVEAMNDEYMASIRRLSEDVGFPIRSVSMRHFGDFASQYRDKATRPKILEHIIKMIKLSERCEADVILLATNEKETPVNEYVDIYMEGLGTPADYAEKRGIILALEHVGLYKPSILEKLVRAINHDAVKVYLDIGNCLWQGEDPVEQARNMGDIVAQLHIKCIRRTTSGLMECPLDQMPLVEVREALERHGYRGRGCLEIPSGNNEQRPPKGSLSRPKEGRLLV